MFNGTKNGLLFLSLRGSLKKYVLEMCKIDHISVNI